ncbi:hypothetical protein Tco_1320315 [Tanacetum coccineum]
MVSLSSTKAGKIFEGMANLGYPIDNTFTFWKKHFTPNWKFMVHHILHCISSKSGGWDQFGSKLATALICLSTGRTYNFSKMIFEAMVANVTSHKKFLMYPRFLSMVLEAKPVNTNLYLAYRLTKKIFGNMNRGFAGVYRPLLANMIAGHDENQGEPQQEPVETQPPPNASVPSTSQPTTEPHPDQELETETELHGSSSDFVHTPPTQVETSSPELKSISPEPIEHTYDQPQPSPVQPPASPEPQPTSPPKSPPLQDPTSTYAEATRIQCSRIGCTVPSIKRVKKIETRLSYGNLPNRKMVLSDLESEDAANSSKQGRNLGEEDVFETPKGKDSGEADISPSGLQAAETLVQLVLEIRKSAIDSLSAEKKKQKVLDVEDIPIPESAKFVKEEEIEVKQLVLKMSRRKSKARKGIGLHTSTEPKSGEVDITSSKIVEIEDSWTWTMLHNISRDDLVDLYKIVLQKTTAYGPEEDLESAFAENLRIMFDPPQSEDTVWSLPMHIPIVNWRYYDSCNVHCLNLHNTTTIYMLAERSYPLSEEVCSMMLKKKLFAQNI